MSGQVWAWVGLVVVVVVVVAVMLVRARTRGRNGAARAAPGVMSPSTSGAVAGVAGAVGAVGLAAVTAAAARSEAEPGQPHAEPRRAGLERDSEESNDDAHGNDSAPDDGTVPGRRAVPGSSTDPGGEAADTATVAGDTAVAGSGRRGQEPTTPRRTPTSGSALAALDAGLVNVTGGTTAARAAQAVAAAVTRPGPHAGSALPEADGSSPSDHFPIKANEGSHRYHTPDSPFFVRTRADLWFHSAADAERAGFTAWNGSPDRRGETEVSP